MAEKLLQLDGITKIFPGTVALDHIQLEVAYSQVHAIVGENGAGKSTMMNIISGLFPATEGKIIFEGQEVHFSGPLDAQEKGISIVHQEINLCPHISVLENIYMGRTPKKSGLVDYDYMKKTSKELLMRFNSDIDPEQKVQSLTIAQQQIVEIVKAISMNCKLLILDEPTSSLTEVETQDLFRIVRDLRASGISVLYISHRLSEIMDLCDQVSVYRDGKYIGTSSVSDITTDHLISMMVGRELDNIYPEKATDISSEVILKATNFSDGNRYRNIDFELHRGEILGFSGLVGAGRSELFRGLCGIDKIISGELVVKGKRLKLKTYREAIDNGLAYVTENRKKDGLFLDYDIRQNIIAASLEQAKSGPFLDRSKENKISEDLVKKISIKVYGLEQRCSSLSGGNQQKVLFAKWLTVNPSILIIDEPTRGIDVGVRLEIYRILRQLCSEGVGVIVISSDLPEILGLCDRVIVMAEGEITGSLDAAHMSEDAVMSLASV